MNNRFCFPEKSSNGRQERTVRATPASDSAEERPPSKASEAYRLISARPAFSSLSAPRSDKITNSVPSTANAISTIARPTTPPSESIEQLVTTPTTFPFSSKSGSPGCASRCDLPLIVKRTSRRFFSSTSDKNALRPMNHGL